ncbi:MAG: tRNA lysidine(34) synthetase TilS, partial [Firmicutes bacterium]|nr:tRNA lysidine(34) synthetase TilS [Bacillota bacterium]
MIKIDFTKKYALAVSGGADSMVMLHMFAALSPRPDFFVVTVNHNIRKEAQSDCDFVRSYCEGLSVECKTFSVDVPTFAAENKLSEETAARILRYRVLDGLQCDYVCLAHHVGDNAETVLMHILRGSGAYGAEGIRQVNGRYLRPILNLDRDAVERYADEHNVPYVHDSTNDETKYTRNFIRQKVLPLLKEIAPNAEKNIARFAENVSEDNEFLDGLADVFEVTYNGNGARVPSKLLLQPRSLAYRAIRKVFRNLGVYKDIERVHIEALYSLARGCGGKSVNLPFGYVATNEYDYVSIKKQSDDVPYF